MKRIYGAAAMLTATVLWGLAFSAQSSGMTHIEPILFTALRSLLGAAVLMISAWGFDLLRCGKVSCWGEHCTPESRRRLLTGGIWCGLVIAAASSLQQYGLKYIPAGKTGFLTALYIVAVPLLGIFFKRRANWSLWLAVAIALTGSWLLCGGISSMGAGEWCVIACALIYSVHVMVIDRYAADCDCVRLSCIQFAVAALVTALGSLILREPWSCGGIVAAMPYWVFCGIGSSAIAFTLQMVAQKYLHPVSATLIMSLESVFAVLGGWLFLHEVLSGREMAGCAVILLAVILAQLPLGKKS